MSRSKTIQKVTYIGLILNLLLAMGKLFAGSFGRSSAMIADGVHSLSDLITDIIVIVFVRFSDKDRDHDHPYGHGKFETFASMLISFALIIVGIGIFWNGAVLVWANLQGEALEQPGMVALYAAIASILIKESLFWYTRWVGVKINSQVLIANAWHHRSDGFSSVGTSIGIAGAIFMGEGWRILDPLTGILVSFFILKVGWDIAYPSIQELLETALPLNVQEDLKNHIKNTEGVLHYHNFKSRKIGDSIGVDVHIKVDKNLTVDESHDIATAIEVSIREQFGDRSHIGIHVEPYLDRSFYNRAPNSKS